MFNFVNAGTYIATIAAGEKPHVTLKLLLKYVIQPPHSFPFIKLSKILSFSSFFLQISSSKEALNQKEQKNYTVSVLLSKETSLLSSKEQNFGGFPLTK